MPIESTATDLQLAQISELMSELLKNECTNTEGSGPIILQKRDFDLLKLQNVRVIEPDNQTPEGSDVNKEYTWGHEIIERLITQGWIITCIFIGHHDCGNLMHPKTEHRVYVVLVKLGD